MDVQGYTADDTGSSTLISWNPTRVKHLVFWDLIVSSPKSYNLGILSLYSYVN